MEHERYLAVSQKCANGLASSKENDKEYSYVYEGETISSVNGSSSAHSALKIKARCNIKSVGPCQHVLKVSELVLDSFRSRG